MGKAKDKSVAPESSRGGIHRRDFIKRAGIVAGTVAWMAPVIQSLAPPAYAHATSPATFGCCFCTNPGGPVANCSGTQARMCLAGPTSITGQRFSSEADCQAHCASLDPARTYCYHSGPNPFTCVTQTGGARCTNPH